ncbi:MAG: glycine--tRNA ligase [Hadesarchaea archaeon]|nr:glycine--tRNA ligase [Hadesarchaea archaeon]
MDIAKRRGFIWPSFEIYGGAAGFYDFGPLGAPTKDNILQEWRDHYVVREGLLELDSPTVAPESVLKASGHVDHFTDSMSECTKCGESFEVTELVKEETGEDIEGLSTSEMEDYLKKKDVRCPKCDGEFGKIFEFNTMFKTAIGPKEDRIAYLRPETAQTIFVDFNRLKRVARKQLPFGVAQIGHGYRNEISPRRGVIRLREFTMAEGEIFFDPEDPSHEKFSEVKDEKLRFLLADAQKDGDNEIISMTAGEALEDGVAYNELMAYHLAYAKKFLVSIGIPVESIRFREQLVGERAHYSKETWDLEVNSEKFGWIEVAGFAYRTDYDLSRHAEASGEDMTVFVQDDNDGRKVLCHVVEPSYGIDRVLYCALEHAYTEEDDREYFKLRKRIAPIKAKVFPLVSEEELEEISREILSDLRGKGIFSKYDDSGSIGRRYARADEVGVPFCITVDHQTPEDSTVTIRERDTTDQIRVKIEELPEIIRKLLESEIDFNQAGEKV